MPGRAGAVTATYRINEESFYESEPSYQSPIARSSYNLRSSYSRAQSVGSTMTSTMATDEISEHSGSHSGRSPGSTTEDITVRIEPKATKSTSSATAGNRRSQMHRHGDTAGPNEPQRAGSSDSPETERAHASRLWELRGAGLMDRESDDQPRQSKKTDASSRQSELSRQGSRRKSSLDSGQSMEVHARQSLYFPEQKPDRASSRRSVAAFFSRFSAKSVDSADQQRSYQDNVTSTSSSSDYFLACALQRKIIRHIMSSPKFDFSIGAVIVCNCFTIGLEQSWEMEGTDTTVLKWLEHLFLSIYIVELGFRFFAFRLSCLHDNWVKFDTFLVVVGIATGWVLPPIMGQIDALGPLMVLRTARLMRLARTVRLLIKFRELWMLVRGLLNSASTMVYTLCMLFTMIYIFSCMSIEIITNHSLATGPDADPEFKAFVDENFGSLPLTMITLMQFASLDNMSMIYMPLIKKSWWLAFFFIGMILVISIVLMNLITAVVVNSALEQAMTDKEAMKAQEDKRRKKLMKDLRRMFHGLDDDQSGQVSQHEMAQMKDEDKTLLYNILGMSDPIEVFMQLDVDGSGLLEIDEFCDGIWQVAISKAPIEIKRLEKQVNSLKDKILESTAAQNDMHEMIENILATVNAQAATRPRVISDVAEEKFDSKASASKESTPSGLEAKASNSVMKCMESLDCWKDSLASDVTGLKEGLTSLSHQISSQLQHLLLEVRYADSHGIIALGEESKSSPFDLRTSPSSELALQILVDAGPVPKWAENLRCELLRAADCVKTMMQEMRKRSRCPSDTSVFEMHSMEQADQAWVPRGPNNTSLWTPSQKPTGPRG